MRFTRTEFRLLVMFLREPMRTFSTEHIIQRVYGYDFEGFDRAVDSQIYNLRRKLADASAGGPFIRTVYVEGYKFTDA